MEEQLKEDTIKYTKEYSVNNDILIETSTPDKIVADVKTYDIKSIREEIDRIDNAIAQWESKKVPKKLLKSESSAMTPNSLVSEKENSVFEVALRSSSDE